MHINPPRDNFVKISLAEFTNYRDNCRPINLDVHGKRRFGYLDVSTGNFVFEFRGMIAHIFVKVKHVL